MNLEGPRMTGLISENNRVGLLVKVLGRVGLLSPKTLVCGTALATVV